MYTIIFYFYTSITVYNALLNTDFPFAKVLQFKNLLAVRFENYDAENIET